ncbi:MAG TPA: permease-like cell division protein FtsX [Patescibacteria group bacterium]|nr:permease-like cell division protein FtsX [Patescibacteria group bacterium]
MNFGRLISITRSRISRSPGHVIAAILVMTASFFAVTVFTFILVRSHIALNYFESLPQVTAFMKDSASSEEIAALSDEVEATGLTSSVKFVSKEEALERYQQQNAGNTALLDLVTADFLPDSLEIQTKSLQDLNKISEILNGKKDTIVEEVIFRADVVANLSRFTTGLRNTALILLGLLLLSLTITSSFITALQTYVNREEIEIMRLIGATKTFVYTPFIMESIFYGVVASIVASVISLAMMPFVLSWFSDLFKGVSAVQVSPLIFAIIVGISLVIGIVTNLLGSYLAVRKYARV